VIRTVLVTGGAGFVGTCLIRRLAQRSDTRVLATYRTNSAPPASEPGIEWVACELADYAEVESLFLGASIDAVVHAAAALPDGKDDYPSHAIRDNVLSTANIVYAAAARETKRMVHCSTISVYEGVSSSPKGFRETDLVAPTSPYARTKLAAESLVALLGDDDQAFGVSLRFAGIHGPDRKSGVVFHMLSAALNDAEIGVNEPNTVFRILFVADAVRAIEAALDSPQLLHRCYNVAGREPTSLVALAEAVLGATGSKSRIRVQASPIARHQILNTDLIESDLAFHPLSLRDNLCDFAAFLAQTKAPDAPRA